MLNKLIMDKQDEGPEAPEDYSDKVNSKEVRLVKDLPQQVIFQSKLGRTTRFQIQAFLNNFVIEKEGFETWLPTRLEKEGLTHLMSSCTKSRKKLPLNGCNHLDLEPKAVVQSVRISGRKKTYSLVMRTDVC